MPQGEHTHREPPAEQPVRDSSGKVIIPLREEQQTNDAASTSSQERDDDQHASS